MASWIAETTAASRELHGLLDYRSTLRGSAEDVCSRADELPDHREDPAEDQCRNAHLGEDDAPEPGGAGSTLSHHPLSAGSLSMPGWGAPLLDVSRVPASKSGSPCRLRPRPGERSNRNRRAWLDPQDSVHRRKSFGQCRVPTPVRLLPYTPTNGPPVPSYVPVGYPAPSSAPSNSCQRCEASWDRRGRTCAATRCRGRRRPGWATRSPPRGSRGG